MSDKNPFPLLPLPKKPSTSPSNVQKKTVVPAKAQACTKLQACKESSKAAATTKPSKKAQTQDIKKIPFTIGWHRPQ
jgi:hypothetical protein